MGSHVKIKMTSWGLYWRTTAATAATPMRLRRGRLCGICESTKEWVFSRMWSRRIHDQWLELLCNQRSFRSPVRDAEGLVTRWTLQTLQGQQRVFPGCASSEDHACENEKKRWASIFLLGTILMRKLRLWKLYLPGMESDGGHREVDCSSVKSEPISSTGVILSVDGDGGFTERRLMASNNP